LPYPPWGLYAAASVLLIQTPLHSGFELDLRVTVTALVMKDPALVIMGHTHHVQACLTRDRTNLPEIVPFSHVVGLWYLLRLLHCCFLCYGPGQAFTAPATLAHDQGHSRDWLTFSELVTPGNSTPL
jgi:hypothetical protein